MKVKSMVWALALLVGFNVSATNRISLHNGYFESKELDTNAKYDWRLHASWNEKGDYVGTGFSPSDKTAYLSMNTSIDLSSSGTQTVYFELRSEQLGDSGKFIPWLDVCDNNIGDESKYLYNSDSRTYIKKEDSYWKIGNQNVKFIHFCRVLDSGSYFFAAPTTQKGRDYVVNALKSDAGQIWISGGSTEVKFFVPVSTDGFKESWDKYGGDAL